MFLAHRVGRLACLSVLAAGYSCVAQAASDATAAAQPAPRGVRTIAAQAAQAAGGYRAAALPATPRDPAGVRPAAAADPVVDPLLQGVLERLAIGEAVARSKFDTGKPVQDTPREQALLDAVARQAPQYGVTGAQARTFFRAQIEAGKVVQTALLARWQRQGGAPGKAVDLGATLRPRLDALSGELLQNLGRVCALPAGSARQARILQARERLAQARKLGALQRAAFDQATSGLCAASAKRGMTLALL
ncbi:hypothetical protein GCM10027419_12290 [Pandoraea terrae]